MSKMVLLASFSYGDIAVVVVLAIGLLGGLAVGLSKSLKESFLVILIASIALCSMTGNALMGTDMGKNLSNTITDSMADAGGPAFSEEIYFTETGDPYMKYDADGDGVEDTVKYKDSFNNSNLKWMGFVVMPFIKHVIPPEGGVSFLSKFGPGITNIIFMVISFILLCIVFKLLLVIITKLYKNFLKDHESFIVIDRILGGLYSGGKAVLFVFVSFAILNAMMGLQFMAPVKEHFANSIICPWIIENNFIVLLFSKVFA